MEINPEKKTRNLSFSVDEILKSESANKKPREDEDIEKLPNNKEDEDSEKDEDFGILTKDGITVELVGKQLWKRFYKLGTEMIITKAGRRMFPTLKIRIKGLKKRQNYIIYLDIQPFDDKRYRYVYQSSSWTVAGSGDPPPNTADTMSDILIHEDSPSLGLTWSSPQNIISFDKLKLTNNRSSIFQGQICLHSMHKYVPRLYIQPCNEPMFQEDKLNIDKLVDRSQAIVFTFPETSFTTVTAYQNQQITKLKIASNPFAKGFREATRTRDIMFPEYFLFPPSPYYRTVFPLTDERFSPYYSMGNSTQPYQAWMPVTSPLGFLVNSKISQEAFKLNDI